MKKQLVIAVVLILILGMVIGFTGCKSKVDPTPSGEPSASGEVVELTFAHPFPALHHHNTGIIEPLVEELREKSNGRINITVIPGGAITTGSSAIDDVTTGAVDMIWTLPGYTAGRFPMLDCIEFADHFGSAEEATRTLWGMLNQSEEFQKEFKDYKVFNLYTADMGEIWTSNKPIRTPDDLAGVSLRAASPMTERTLNAYGASTANMAMPDTYDNIERGVVNGLATGPSAIPTYKLDEVVNYGTIGLNLYASPQIMCISWSAWNKLSAEDQALFESLTGEALSVKSAVLYDEISATAREGIEGVEFYELSPDEKALFQEKAKNVMGDYIAEITGKGYDGQAFYDLMISVRDGLR